MLFKVFFIIFLNWLLNNSTFISTRHRFFYLRTINHWIFLYHRLYNWLYLRLIFNYFFLRNLRIIRNLILNFLIIFYIIFDFNRDLRFINILWFFLTLLCILGKYPLKLNFSLIFLLLLLLFYLYLLLNIIFINFYFHLFLGSKPIIPFKIMSFHNTTSIVR